ncbi:MAG TPA: hypothetical protein VE912_09965 [Bacteroidales bacterium]|nr:hypothetical protein [Bacteroidales bacterium]
MKIKNIFPTVLIILFGITSCGPQNVTLFNALHVQFPTTFTKDRNMEHTWVDSRNGAVLKFSMTKNKSFGALLPTVSFDELYQAPLHDTTEKITDREIRKISGLKIGIIQKYVDSTAIKTFFTEVNNEILMGKLEGDIKYDEYLKFTFDKMINSIEPVIQPGKKTQ